MADHLACTSDPIFISNESQKTVKSAKNPDACPVPIHQKNWQQLLDDGVVGSGSEIAQREGLHHSTVNELLRLTLLEPAIIQSILAGQQPRCMSLLWFQRNPLSTDWVAQREAVAGFDA